ncbi:MAG: Fe-S cluster assembly protein SufB [candidate division FCPU426 bacterium]
MATEEKIQLREDLKDQVKDIVTDDYEYGFHDNDVKYAFKAQKGLNADIVRQISMLKKEPKWMLDFRLRAYETFVKKPMPTFLSTNALDDIDFSDIYYFMRATEGQGKTWEDVPEGVKRTFERLGIPEAERKFLAGVSAQYDSEVVYHSVQEELTKQGVLFMDMDSGLREHEDIVKKYMASIIPIADNKFSALNSAVWSGGSFVYVPKGVKVAIPLQAYFRINSDNMGQFERTLIIADEGSSVHYIEGCTAPTYSNNALHSAVVELIAMKGAKIRYTTIQNWSKNVYNLVTKRAAAYEDARVEWIDGNLGSKLTVKYPAIYLLGERASGEVLSVAMAGSGQHQDAGAKIVAVASNTSATVTSKSISKDGGRTSYRGLVRVYPGATGVRVNTVCDALLMDEDSRSDTYPTMQVDEKDVNIGHEATVSKIGAEQLFYLSSRGISEDDARLMVVNGFIEPFTKELPLEYAVELNRLMQLEMKGGIG